MDYRHVAKNFRRCALLVQLSLLSSLAAYAAYRALRIMQSGDTPAADISVKHWHGYSAWAVCCIPGYDPTRYCNGVRAAGVGFFESFDGLRVAWTPNGTGLTANSHKLASSVISQRTISFAGYALTCSVWDLTEVPEMMIPGTFSLCTPIHASWLMVMSDGQWRWIDHAGRKMYYSLKLTSYIHGFNFGYTSVPHQFFTATTVKMWQAGVPEMCAWSGVDSETEALLSQTTVFTVLVEDQYIVATMEQGFLLQLFNLASGLGGYLSILTVVFGIIFVKQYPESRIAHVFESRTLFGKQAKGDPPDDEEALDDRQPYVAPASSQSPVCTASTLVSHAIGLTQVDKRELPALPPGIVRTGPSAQRGRESQQMPALPPRDSE